MSRGQAIGVSAYGSVQGIYNVGFSPIDSLSGTAATQPVNLSGGGLMLDGGILGYYQKQRHATSFTARGLYSNNSAGNQFNNHGFNLEAAHSHQITRRLQFFTSVAGAKTNFTGQFLYRFTEEPVAQAVNPGFEIFDSHLTTVTGAAGVTFQKSRNWTFSAQGGAFGADRRERSLIDTRGASASGSAQYNINRRTATGVSYGYSWYFFPGNFGETRSHNGQIFFNRQIGRRWSASLAAGIFSAFTERLISVPLDPFIQQITGQTTGLRIFRGTNTGWTGSGTISAQYRNSSFDVRYGRSLQAGNGVYLTSVADLGTVVYTRQARRSWALNLTASYSRLSAITQELGRGTYQTAGGSVTRSLTSYMNLVGSAGYFRTNVFSGRFARDRVYISGGIQFSPHDLPILR